MGLLVVPAPVNLCPGGVKSSILPVSGSVAKVFGRDRDVQVQIDKTRPHKWDRRLTHRQGDLSPGALSDGGFLFNW